MCGIIGMVETKPVAPDLVEALGRLEYRGYDSVGVATIEGNLIRRVRAKGRVGSLARRLDEEPLVGTTGIGHTRWATHGAPEEHNAHPHATSRVAVVHNGIVENHNELRHALVARGRVFESETDTEVIVHLVDEGLEIGLAPTEALVAALRHLRGTYAVAAIFRDHHELLVAARVGSPLVVGISAEGAYVASDAMALASRADRVAYLEDGDVAEVHRGRVTISRSATGEVSRPFVPLPASSAAIEKGEFRHFMQKEIFEQPEVLARTLEAYLDVDAGRPKLPSPTIDLAAIRRVSVIACGTSYYAGLAARRWFETVARVPVELDVASEHRYRDAPFDPGTLTVVISQSGETADTLAAMRSVAARGGAVAAVVNVASSTIAREATWVLPTYAGPEIGVASTKAFTTQLVVLAALAVEIARANGAASSEAVAEAVRELHGLPAVVRDVLESEPAIRRIAADVVTSSSVLFVGRGPFHALALEGALKLKEISYLHAEGFASGELKHGPLALVDEDVPVICLAPVDELHEKTMSNAQEIAARKGRLCVVTEPDGTDASAAIAHSVLVLPSVGSWCRPIVFAIPLQLLAYHAAVLRGNDVDRPRNLAKSVTVE